MNNSEKKEINVPLGDYFESKVKKTEKNNSETVKAKKYVFNEDGKKIRLVGNNTYETVHKKMIKPKKRQDSFRRNIKGFIPVALVIIAASSAVAITHHNVQKNKNNTQIEHQTDSNDFVDGNIEDTIPFEFEDSVQEETIENAGSEYVEIQDQETESGIKQLEETSLEDMTRKNMEDRLQISINYLNSEVLSEKEKIEIFGEAFNNQMDYTKLVIAQTLGEDVNNIKIHSDSDGAGNHINYIEVKQGSYMHLYDKVKEKESVYYHEDKLDKDTIKALENVRDDAVIYGQILNGEKSLNKITEMKIKKNIEGTISYLGKTQTIDSDGNFKTVDTKTIDDDEER